MNPLPLPAVQRILLVKMSAIGDVVLATPVATALRRRFPAAHIGWLVEDRNQPILAYNPDVDEVIVWRKAELQTLWRRNKAAAWRQQRDFVRTLRASRWDLAIDLQGLLKSAVLTYLSGARWRIGPHSGSEGSRFFYTHRAFLPPERWGVYAGERYCAMLEGLGWKGESPPLRLVWSSEEEAFADRFLSRHGVTSAHLLVSLCPAAAPKFFTKFWFPARWAAVADGLQREFGARVLFHGAPSDRPLVESIVRHMATPPIVATGQTTLLQAAALLQRSHLCVSMETGLQHFAVAVGTPVVVLLGPTVNTPPPPHVAVIHPYPCQPCARRPTCRFQDGVGECLAAITAEEVLQACRQALQVEEAWPLREG